MYNEMQFSVINHMQSITQHDEVDEYGYREIDC